MQKAGSRLNVATSIFLALSTNHHYSERSSVSHKWDGNYGKLFCADTEAPVMGLGKTTARQDVLLGAM